jgi:hypothetical protein
MSEFLYKVSTPRPDLMFYPSTFWRSLDWESSTTNRRDDYIKEEVLYAGDFDEVNIHLFPRVRTVRVRARDADHRALQRIGLSCEPGKTAYIFSGSSCRDEVESFRPMIYTFSPNGFTKVRNGEYVSRTPQRAASFETFTMAEAIGKWNVQACYTADLDGLIAKIRQKNIYLEEQT